MTETRYDVLIIGGGPAGLAAAVTARQSGARVAIVDDNPHLGGQIWRGGEQQVASPEAATWLQRVKTAQVEFIHGARIYDQPQPNVLLAETDTGVLALRYGKLILATGARERFLPFPGWTLPGVMGAGGLQALVKAGWPAQGKQIVIAGTGPLLLAVAAYLKKAGARVLLIAEQAPASKLFSFGLGLWSSPGKLVQAAQLKRKLAGIAQLTGCWPVAAHGETQLQSVTLRRGTKTWQVACDYLACGFHLVPNTELAVYLGCDLSDGAVQVDEWQATTAPDVYCAGESTGIGGLELSLVEGQIAGLAATGQTSAARSLFAERDKQQRFAVRLNQAFALREELKELPQPDTLVCRCEDVTLARLRECDGWRAAKLHTRCGMGPCQGRICSGAVDFLFNWQTASVRPPVFPVRVGSLMQNIQNDSCQ